MTNCKNVTDCSAQHRTENGYTQTENGLHRDEQRWNAECLKEDLSRLLAVVSWI